MLYAVTVDITNPEQKSMFMLVPKCRCYLFEARTQAIAEESVLKTARQEHPESTNFRVKFVRVVDDLSSPILVAGWMET
ncbi:MAG: hypothetical protein WC824_10800 [Bacteroidota bacterium]|jgi:hypothetical protein